MPMQSSTKLERGSSAPLRGIEVGASYSQSLPEMDSRDVREGRLSRDDAERIYAWKETK